MIHLRIAKPENCLAVFKLSNDPVVRSVSFSSEAILYETHVQWFMAKLEDPDCLFLLFFEADELVAQVRFDRAAHKSDVEISISVASQFRGKGLALDIMREAQTFLNCTWGLSRIKALVKVENEASIRYFEKAGYVFLERIKHRGCDCNVYFYESR